LDAYLDAPTEAQLNEPYHLEVRDAISKLKLGPHTDPTKAMKRVLQLSESNDKHKQIYKTLLMLVNHDDNSTEGLEPLIKLLVSIRSRTIKTNDLKHSNIFLFHFEWFKFAKWAPKVESDFREISDIRVLNEFDALFRRAMDINKRIVIANPDEALILSKLWNELKEFEMDKDDIESRKMLDYLDTTGDGSTQSNSKRLELFANFMNSNCAELQQYKSQLDIVNMANALYRREIIEPRLGRMAEYYRICLDWKRPGTHKEIMKNVKRHLYGFGLCGTIAAWLNL
jgi:hypothetical protein